MILLFLILRSCSRLIEADTIVRPESGPASMPCKWRNLIIFGETRRHMNRIGWDGVKETYKGSMVWKEIEKGYDRLKRLDIMHVIRNLQNMIDVMLRTVSVFVFVCVICHCYIYVYYMYLWIRGLMYYVYCASFFISFQSLPMGHASKCERCSKRSLISTFFNVATTMCTADKIGFACLINASSIWLLAIEQIVDLHLTIAYSH